MTAELVSLAHDCETAQAFELGALDVIRRAVGFDAAFFLVKGLEQAVTTVGFDATMRAQLAIDGARYSDELMPVKQAALAARGVAVDTQVRGVEQVQKTGYYRDIASKVGGRHSLMAYVPWRGETVAAVMLGRGGNGFCEREVSLIESLLPALGLARAVYGLAQLSRPLPRAPALSPLQRLRHWQGSHVLASANTRSGKLVVRDRGGFREMVGGDGASELVWTRVALENSNVSGWPYIELFHLAPALAKQRGRALFIGCGGAVGLRQFATAYRGMALDLVELEAAVIELARDWFDLGAIPGVTIHIAEGTAFVRAALPCSWDVLVIDAYDASTFAAQFCTGAFLRAVRRVLRPGGTVACNVIGTLSGDSAVSRYIAAASAVFEKVRVVPVVDPDERYCGAALRNVVVVATRGDEFAVDLRTHERPQDRR
jgi:spermidine synthase